LERGVGFEPTVSVPITITCFEDKLDYPRISLKTFLFKEVWHESFHPSINFLWWSI